MDPLSVSASVIALLQATTACIRYIHDIKDARQDRLRLAHEMSSLSLVLQGMDDRLLDAGPRDSWLQGCSKLNGTGGVFEKIRDIITEIEDKISPESGIKKLNQKLSWPFSKSDVDKRIAEIERLKSQIILVLQDDHIRLSKKILRTTENTQESIELARNDEEFDKIVAWLSPLKFREQQQSIYDQATPMTGKWLLQSDQFNAWTSGQINMLYCVGAPGAGKTVLSSIIINHLQKEGLPAETPVLFIYLNHKDSREQTLGNLIGALIRQLLQLKAPTVPNNYRKLWKECQRGETRPKIEQLMDNFVSELKTFKKSYIVIDALDECLDEITRQKLLEHLYSLQKSGVHIFVTSRSMTDTLILDRSSCNACGTAGVSRSYHCDSCNKGDYGLCKACVDKGETSQNSEHIRHKVYSCQKIDMKAAFKDIRLYLEEKLRTEPRLVSVCKKDPRAHESIVSKVMEVVDGVFLFAKLWVDVLKNKPTPKAVRKTLESPPETLDQLYEDTMNRIEKQSEDDFMYAKEILMWVTWSKRALSKKELLHALAVSREDEDLDETEVLDESYLFSVTGGLIFADHEGKVRPVHKTVDGFLRKNEQRWFGEADHELALITLTYLKFENLAEPCQGSNEDVLVEQRLIEYPFLVYASEYWGEHAKENYLANRHVRQAILIFVRSASRVASATQAALYLGSGSGVRNGVNGLHLCAWFGLETIVSDLIDEGIPIDSQDPEYGITPLMYACRRGHTDVVRLLLKHGASVNTAGTRGCTALFSAVLNKQKDVVRELMKIETLEVNAKHSRFSSETALHFAVEVESVDIVELLLARSDIRVNERDSEGFTALMLAAASSEPALLHALLQHPNSDIKAVGGPFGRTALYYAAFFGRTKNICALIERNADPNIKDPSGKSPISLAVYGGHTETIRTMIRLGADIHVRDRFGNSLLHIAQDSENSGTELARILLEAGLNINAQANRGETCLHDAASIGNLDYAAFLIEKGIDMSITDDDKRIALEVAIQNGNYKIANLIRNKAPKKNQIDYDSQFSGTSDEIPVWAMAKLGHLKDIEIYIQNGGDLDVEDLNTGTKALHNAVIYDQIEILDLLLATKTDINCPDQDGNTALHHSARLGRTDSAKLLIANKANLDSKDEADRSPLLVAQNAGHWEIAALLIEANASMDPGFGTFQKEFFAAVQSGKVNAVKRLIDKGVDVELHEETSGSTALQVAKQKGHMEIVEIIRQHMTLYPYKKTPEESEDKTSTSSQASRYVSYKHL